MGNIRRGPRDQDRVSRKRIYTQEDPTRQRESDSRGPVPGPTRVALGSRRLGTDLDLSPSLLPFSTLSALPPGLLGGSTLPLGPDLHPGASPCGPKGARGPAARPAVHRHARAAAPTAAPAAQGRRAAREGSGRGKRRESEREGSREDERAGARGAGAAGRRPRRRRGPLVPRGPRERAELPGAGVAGSGLGAPRRRRRERRERRRGRRRRRRPADAPPPREGTRARGPRSAG